MTHPAPVPSESAQPPAPDFEAAQEALELLSEEIGSVWAVEPCEKIQATLDEAESRLSLLAAQNAELQASQKDAQTEIVRLDTATLEWANAAVLLLAELEAAKADTERLRDDFGSAKSVILGLLEAAPRAPDAWLGNAKWFDVILAAHKIVTPPLES